MPRKTINKEIKLSGIGLHTGKPSELIIRPAFGSGIRFFRPGFKKPIRALLSSVSGTMRGTNISDGHYTIHTVEHILSAAFALEFDDLDIEIKGEEPPIADGSALPFAKLLLSAGFKLNEGQSDMCRLKFPFELRLGDTFYKASIAEKGLQVSLVYENAHPLIGKMEICQTINAENFINEIAPARTFGYESELELLKKAGLAKGGTLENAVVITKSNILAAGGLRYENEPVRHKLLDFLGDLALLGQRPQGLKIYAYKCGHAGNVKFAKLLGENCACL